MKNKTKILSIFLFLTVFFMFVSCQKQKAEWKGTIEEVDGVTVVKNSETSLSKNAGRVLRLREIMRIIDTGKDFYFRSPSGLKIAPNGSIFIKDDEQLLQFDSKGRFNRNFFKKGQGPGEIDDFFEYHIFKDDIFIYDFKALKIIHTDLEGNLVKQIKIESGPYNDFYGVTKDWYIFKKDMFPPSNERKSQLQNTPFAIRLVSKDGKTEKESCISQRIMFLGPGSVTTWTRLFSILSEDGKKLYFSHTNEYLVEVLDLEKSKIIKRFNRKYPRAKYIKRGWEDNFYKRYNVPEIKFEYDIRGLFIDNGLLWVKTSTRDKKKGQMFDSFNSEGKFLDNFYLGINGTLLAIHRDSIFVLEKDEDENLQIVKYKIIGGT